MSVRESAVDLLGRHIGDSAELMPSLQWYLTRSWN